MMIIIILLVFVSVVSFTMAIYKFSAARDKNLDDRLDKYLDTENFLARQEVAIAEEESKEKKSLISPKLIDKLNQFFASRSLTTVIEGELKKTNLPIKASEFIILNILSLLVLGTAGLLLIKNILLTIVLILAALLAPYIYLKISQKRRLNKFNDQIADSLSVISNSLKAGYSFFQSMEMVAKEMSPPISDEFTRVLKEVNLGAPAEEALEALTERVESDDLDLVITAVLIQRQVGGNLSEILDSISHTIRERVRIQGEIKTLTAQGRASGFIIAILPIALGLVLSLINSEYMSPLFSHPLGKMMLGVGFVSQLVGALIIKKIINIEV
jgi:tight adherence protein B